MIRRASRMDYENVLASHKHPDHRWGHASEAAKRAAEEECGRNFDELVFREVPKRSSVTETWRQRITSLTDWRRATSGITTAEAAPRWLGFRVTESVDFICKWKDLINEAINGAVQCRDDLDPQKAAWTPHRHSLPDAPRGVMEQRPKRSQRPNGRPSSTAWSRNSPARAGRHPRRQRGDAVCAHSSGPVGRDDADPGYASNRPPCCGPNR